MASAELERMGLNIQIYKPEFTVTGPVPSTITSSLPGTPLATFDAFDALSWSSQANGGFQSCTWTVPVWIEDAERWLQEGLGASVEIRDETGVIRWDGRINQIVITVGGLRWTWGPLTEVTNRVGVRYTTIDTSTTPPTEGEQAFYGWNEGTDSEGLYGVNVGILSTGGVTATDAYWMAYSWAVHNSWPKVSCDVAMGQQAGQMTVQFQAMGWGTWLNYPYTQTATTGTVAIATQVANILDADPNGFFSSANAEIYAPFLTRPQYENQDRTAWDLIRSLAMLANFQTYRCLAYVGPERFFKFTARAPGFSLDARDPDYQISLGNTGHWQVRTINGALVRPWQVEAGKFAMITDILPGREFMDTIYPLWWQQDPRLMFIEKVTFTAPDQLQLQGGSPIDAQEALKQYGLGQA